MLDILGRVIYGEYGSGVVRWNMISERKEIRFSTIIKVKSITEGTGGAPSVDLLFIDMKGE
jgi:hypothetical protein